jgi:hypothetical protein
MLWDEMAISLQPVRRLPLWIFTNQGFISAVTDFNSQGHLLVRARAQKHLTALFPKAKVAKTPDADYLYRASIPQAEVARVIAEQVQAVDYTNFKNSIPDDEYHTACSSVWHVMHRYQGEVEHRKGSGSNST